MTAAASGNAPTGHHVSGLGSAVPRGQGGGSRDPRSIEWEPAVRSILAAAIRAQRQRKGVLVWIQSPSTQFRHKDAGGRTGEERAFTRSIYYPIICTPRNAGIPRVWSLQLRWGDALQ